jgi:hypothetical protein
MVPVLAHSFLPYSYTNASFLVSLPPPLRWQVFLFSDNMLLDDLAKLWSQHRLVMTTLRDNLLYLDREYNKQNRKMPNFDALKVYFRDFVIRDARVSIGCNLFVFALASLLILPRGHTTTSIDNLRSILV